MATLANFLGYSTNFLGVVGNIYNCKRIALCSSSVSPEIKDITLNSLESIYKKLKNEGKTIEVDRNPTTDSFLFTFTETPTAYELTDFDLIVYLSNTDYTPVGYTKFLTLHGGPGESIEIKLVFSIEVSDNLKVIISNSLSILKNNSTSINRWEGDKPYNYPTASKIGREVSKLIPIGPQYTTNIGAVLYGENKKGIVTRHGYITSSLSTLSNIRLNTSIDFDVLSVGLDRFRAGYFERDLAIFSWNEKSGKYSIYSLTKKSRFSKPLSYLKTGLGFDTIPLREKEILTNIVGKYSTVENTETGEKKIINIETKKVVDFGTNKSGLLDFWSVNSLIPIPTFVSYDNMPDVLPEMSSIHLNLSTYSTTNSITPSKRYGSWFVIPKLRSDIENITVYSSVGMTVVVRSDEEIIPINSKVLAVKGVKDREDYFTIYKGRGEWITEKARMEIYKVPLEYNEEVGIFHCPKDWDKYLSGFRQGHIKKVDFSTPIYKTYFSEFRRKSLLDSGLLRSEEIVSSVDGILILFDKDTKTIKVI